MPELEIGASQEETLLVTSEVAIDFLGQEDARVLATPYLIAYMEMTARNLAKSRLEAGHDTVGTMVNIRHLAATPIGMLVTFRAKLLNVDGRRLLFEVEAFDEKERIGEGTHERAIVNIARFAARLKAKSDGQ